MTLKVTIELTEAEAVRLSKADWEMSIGWGVRLPYTLQRAEARIRWAVANALAAREGGTR